MSNFVIEDGTGDAYLASVDSNHRLQTKAVSVTENKDISSLGNAFNINTGIITLTSANKSALLYYKNNSTTHDAVVSKIIYLFGTPTSGSGDSIMTGLRNPTAGTIVSNALLVEMDANRNFGSTTTFGNNAYKGAEGYTFTDGDKFLETITGDSNSRSVILIDNIVLPQGKSMGFEYTPPAGTTSQQVAIAIEVYYRKA